MGLFDRRYRLGCLLLLACLGAAGAENLLSNGSFEGGVAPWRGAFGVDAAALQVTDPSSGAGAACLRFDCDGHLAGVDHPDLRLGREISRRGTYRLSALLRNDGVRAGGFGLRLYYYDAAGRFLAMQGGLGIATTTPAHGWQRYETRFGRDTANPMPAGAARLTVRFSFWSEDERPIGRVWLDDVRLERLAEAPLPAASTVPVALLWSEDAPAIAGGARAADLEGVLAGAGLEVRRVDTAALSRPGSLDEHNAAVLVLPYGPFYPAPLASSLTAFMAEGGLLVTLGTGALSAPLYPSARGWVPSASPLSGAAAVAVDFGSGWTLAEAAPEAGLLLEPAADGRSGVFHRDPPGAFAYRGTALPPMPAEDVIVAFEARGDAATPRLCLELRERDGSRWKAIVALTPSWQSYRLHMGSFVAYASEALGRSEGPIRPVAVDRLFVGMTAAMVDAGPGQFEMRSLRLEPAAVSTATVAGTPALAASEQEVARWFGAAAHLPPGRVPALSCFAPDAAAWRAERLEVPAGVPLPAPTSWRGALHGLSIGSPPAAVPPAAAGRGSLSAALRGNGTVERLVLLQTPRRWRTPGADAAAFFTFRDGPLAGGRWLCLGLPAPVVTGDAALAGLLQASLGLARSAVVSDGVQPRFRVADGAVVMDVVMRARAPAGRGAALPLGVRVSLGGREAWSRPAVVTLPGDPGAAAEAVVAAGIPVAGQDWLDLAIAVEPAAESLLLGPRGFRLAAREALRQIADTMVAAADDDGLLHGNSFIDNRGMRALLAAAVILDEPSYRRPALRWGRIMMERQRPDGGYRMGYGITSRGEECYVADGGEIAVAIARLAADSIGRQRQEFMASLDAYMAFRESFRVPTGGIGVGWCLTDYGRRPLTRLETPTRILAPELNTYTITCTLAAAYAHAALHGSRPLEHRAEADAMWLLPRVKALHGAAIESLQYAHALTTDPTQRAIYADAIERAFSATLREAGAAGSSWWLFGGSRSALDLGGLAYVLACLGDRATMAGSTSAMVRSGWSTSSSPSSVWTASCPA